MPRTFSQEDVVERIKRVVDRLGFIPGREFLEQVDYWNELVQASDKLHPKGFEGLVEEHITDGYFSTKEVTIPSLEQRLVGATIAQRRRVLELSKPGTRKTIAALSAVVPIEETILPELYPGQKRLRTFITCPGYILPTWKKEIERLFVNPQIAIVTRGKRNEAIERAELPETNFVLVGYDMTYRLSATGNGVVHNGDRTERYFNLMDKLRSTEAAREYLRTITGRDGIGRAASKLTFPQLINHIIDTEDSEKSKQESDRIIEALRRTAFKDGTPYYAIIDEFHNIVSHNKKRAQTIAAIAKPAEWLTLISGTGIGNTAEGLAWGASLLGYVEEPEDFIESIRGKQGTKKVRAFLDQYAIQPVRTLRDIDPQVPTPIIEESRYEITPTEMDLFVALLNSTEFDGREKYHLFRYVLSNPKKLLPENFEHLTTGDDPLHERIENFFAANQGLEDRLRRVEVQSRIAHVRKLVEEAKARGEKCIVACEYRKNTTTELERQLADLGVRRVDLTVSSEIKEIPLTDKEIDTLRIAAAAFTEDRIYLGSEKSRSDLLPTARVVLGIKDQEVYGLSDREKVLHEFATDPDITALVSTRVLREGVELKEATAIIDFEPTTVPSKDEQFCGRTVRSGQRKQVYVRKLRSEPLRTLEDSIENYRLAKQAIIDRIFRGMAEETTEEDIQRWIDEGEEDSDHEIGGIFEGLRSRTLLSALFNSLEGSGSMAFSEAMQQHQNAEFLAKNYNNQWERTYSGNVAKLTRDVVLALEKRKGITLEALVDAGSGPLTLARMLGRKTTAIDMNRFQLEYGVDACVDGNIKPSTIYLGDITDMTRLVPFDEKETSVFDPRQAYEKTARLEERTQDMVVASLVLDLLDTEGRYKFMRESHRVLRDNGYLMIVLPSKKIEESCRMDFVADAERMGFKNVDFFTGTYQEKKYHEKLEAYVVVLQKDPSLKVIEEMPRLQLRPEIRIREGGNASVIDTARERRYQEQYLDGERFVKVEDGMDLLEVMPEVKTEYAAEILRVTSESNPDDIDQALADISKIVRGAGYRKPGERQ